MAEAKEKSGYFPRAAFLGLGLIGGSLARAVAHQYPKTHIAAYDIRAEAVAFGQAQGFVHAGCADAAEAVDGADLVIFTCPPAQMSALAQAVCARLKRGAVITDVASVKRLAEASIRPYLPEHAVYIPGHPVAGSEKTGVEAADAHLFFGKTVILTPPEPLLSHPALPRLAAFWQSLGANIAYMPADLHDRVYAYVSHLPQMAAYAAAMALEGIVPGIHAGYARLARSNLALWAEIGLANADYIIEAIESFQSFAAQIAGELMEPEAGEQKSAADSDVTACLTAVCLIAAVTECEERIGVELRPFAGTGFADMTRPASGDPEAMLTTLSETALPASQSLMRLLAALAPIQRALASGERTALLAAMQPEKRA